MDKLVGVVAMLEVHLVAMLNYMKQYSKVKYVGSKLEVGHGSDKL